MNNKSLGYCNLKYLIKILDEEKNIKNIYGLLNISGKNKLSKNNLNKIINNINNSDISEKNKIYSILFLNRLFKIYRYVDFEEYLNKVINLSIELLKLIKENVDKKFLFIVPGAINKSNTWMLFLFLNEIKNQYGNDIYKLLKDCYVIADYRIIYDYENINNVIFNNAIYIYFDDMSYSGSQVLTNLSNFNFKIYFFCPYYSIIAAKRIKNINNTINFFKTTEFIESFKNQFIKDYDYGNIILNEIKNNDIYNNAFQYNNDLIPIYFDHKIADAVSTFQKIILLGTYPVLNEKSKCTITSLIDECIDNNKYDKNYCNNKELDLYQLNRTKNKYCINSYYKTFNYIYKNFEFNKYTNIVEFSENIEKIYYDTGDINMINKVKGGYYKYQKYKFKYNNLKNNNVII